MSELVFGGGDQRHSERTECRDVDGGSSGATHWMPRSRGPQTINQDERDFGMRVITCLS